MQKKKKRRWEKKKKTLLSRYVIKTQKLKDKLWKSNQKERCNNVLHQNMLCNNLVQQTIMGVNFVSYKVAKNEK